MIILWIRKRKKDKSDDQSEKNTSSFKKHGETMKQFRREHPDIEAVSSRGILTQEGNLLAPIDKVILTDYVQN